MSGKSHANLYCKGLFGTVCGHAFPQMFVNVEVGEKFVYLHYIVTHLISLGYAPAYIDYDIACRAQPYLRRFESSLKALILQQNPQAVFRDGPTTVAGMMFAIGRWHAYGHQSSCHSLWSALFQTGFGLCDGEDMERLWTILNKYAGSTSQMNLGNRNDNLSLILLHLGDVKASEMAYKVFTVYPIKHVFCVCLTLPVCSGVLCL
jgi:hypothetical protein